MKWIDLPPAWLALAIALMWAETRLTGGIPLPSAVTLAGWVLIAFGVVVTGLAAVSFLRAKTSIIPRQRPDAIITSGLYRFSRNPIYLADAAMLAGAGLVLGALSVVIVLPGFVGLITRRYISGEEAGLAARFPEEWAAYSARVRRWL